MLEFRDLFQWDRFIKPASIDTFRPEPEEKGFMHKAITVAVERPRFHRPL
jgi:hypothetical protein